MKKKFSIFYRFLRGWNCGGKQRRSHTTPTAAVIRWVRPEVVNSLTVLCNGCPAASVLVNDLFFHFNSFENYHRKIHNHGTYMKRNLGFCIGNVEVRYPSRGVSLEKCWRFFQLWVHWKTFFLLAFLRIFRRIWFYIVVYKIFCKFLIGFHLSLCDFVWKFSSHISCVNFYHIGYQKYSSKLLQYLLWFWKKILVPLYNISIEYMNVMLVKSWINWL